MHRIWTAIRVFFLTLFHADTARQVGEILARRQTTAGGQQPAEPPKLKPPEGFTEPRTTRATVRSEAMTLLAALQREARLVDFVKEPLGSYSDAQIGAVARDVHRDCGAVLERMFALRPLSTAEEGSAIEVPAGFDAARYRLIGDVTGEPPLRGRLMHHGWEATTCQLPAWSGSADSARIIAPLEVELKQERTEGSETERR